MEITEPLISLSLATIKSFFFFFPSDVNRESDNEFNDTDKALERWLNEDEITSYQLKNPNNKKYLKELEILKKDFRQIYYGKVSTIAKEVSGISISQLFTLILANKVQIARLRFVISPETFINIHEHPTTGYKYSVMRAYWISDNLKKVKKYSYSIGNAEKLSKAEYDRLVKEAYSALKKTLEDVYESQYRK